ncbi:TonB-dependent receptor [Neptunomonas sp.]|uniref:TonB-dependent receptor n=1 Tax=Neptunomonas TaxID=75687 RepID=UPI0035194E5C
MSHQKMETAFSLRSDFSEKSPVSKAGTLAFAISAALATQGVYAEEVTLDKLMVEEQGIAADGDPYAEPDAPYKAKKLSDARQTRDIADTPHTMTVMTKEAIAESGKTELKDLLSAQPGITLGTGEGGNSFGDRYIIRGYEARSDVFTDGLREPGLITRETFALEQIEISKGPNSTFAGRGSTGGSVNTVTKKANVDDTFTTVEAGLGTDKYKRVTLDTNQVLSSDTAVRLNMLYTDSDTPNRAPTGEQRQGVLASVVHQATEDLKVSADYYHFKADDVSDTGYAINRGTGGVNKYDTAAQKGSDFQHGKADIFTVTVNYDVSDDIRLENKTRIGSTKNEYVVTAYQGVSDRFPTGLRNFTGWQDNDYVGNQTNFVIDKDIAGMRNTIVAGVEYANEKVKAGNFTVDTTATGTVDDPYNIDSNFWSGTVTKSDATSETEIETISLYLMDTVTVNDWLEVFGGLRYDHFDYKLESYSNDETYKDNDGLVNGHLGVVFSPWDHGNVYASWSTSSNINGGELDAGTNCGYGGHCDGGKPEEAVNLELGTKWNLMDEKLLLTAAIFQTTKDKVNEGADYDGEGVGNTGENRVRGIELGLAGNITPKLSGQFGMAIMSSEILDSYYDGTKALSGRGGVTYPDYIGADKPNFADKSANLQLRYQATPQFAFGGTVTYSSEMSGGQPDGAASDTVKLPSYTVYDMFATYDFSRSLSVTANVQNLTDEEYYTAVYRGGSIVYIGDGRSAKVSLKYKF